MPGLILCQWISLYPGSILISAPGLPISIEKIILMFNPVSLLKGKSQKVSHCTVLRADLRILYGKASVRQDICIKQVNSRKRKFFLELQRPIM